MIYTDVLNRGPLSVRSPADLLWQVLQVVHGPVNQCYSWTIAAETLH